MKRVFPCLTIISLLLPLHMVSENSPRGVVTDFHEMKTNADSCFNNLLYDQAEPMYKRILENAGWSSDAVSKVAITNNLVTCLWRQEKYKEAEDAARENLDFAQKKLGDGHLETGEAYQQLGVLSFLSGYIGITDAYLAKAIDIYNQLSGPVNLQSAHAYEWLGMQHNAFSDSANARKYLWKALSIQRQLHTDSLVSCAELYRYIGLFYKRYSVFDSSMFYFKTAKQLFDNEYSVYNFHSIKCLNNMADVHEWFGRIDSALDLHRQSLFLYKNSTAKNLYTLMMTCYNLAELYANNSQYDSALKYIQKVLKLYYKGLNETNLLENPLNADSLPYAIPKISLILKAACLQKMYLEDSVNNLSCLISSAACYALAHRIIQEMNKGFPSIEELIFSEHMHSNLYLNMAENALHLYNKLGETLYLSAALTYLSINRNVNLAFNDEAQRNKYRKYLPTEYIETKILFEKELNELLSRRMETGESAITAPVNISIAEMKIRLDNLSYFTLQKHPGIIDSLGIGKQIGLSEITGRLKEQQVLLWFHEHCSDYVTEPFEILTIVIAKDGLNVYKNDGKKISQLIGEYGHLITEKPYSVNPLDLVGYELYRMLVEPVNELRDKKEIIVIPSQHISLIPFDALPTTLTGIGKSHGRMIHSYTIWNEFSLQSFLSQQNERITQNNVLAIVPAFNRDQKAVIALLTNRDTSLVNLPGALAECERIAGLFPTKILSGAQATRALFEENCRSYKILHLSTHGLPDKNDKTIVRLVFSDYEESVKSGLLNIYEVMNLSLRSELVVLSACRTGLGAMSKGEGNLNLAWAFKHAGAHSVLVSLWDANDYASSVIMPSFYQYLAEGMSKPKALHQAKLDFIGASDELTSAPFFWGGFNYWGNDLPVIGEKKFGKITTILLFGSLIFVLMMIIVFRRLF